jgi:hypothetical protein
LFYSLFYIFSNAVNRLVCLTETTVASGDDEGCIKVLNVVLILLVLTVWPLNIGQLLTIGYECILKVNGAYLSSATCSNYLQWVNNNNHNSCTYLMGTCICFGPTQRHLKPTLAIFSLFVCTSIFFTINSNELFNSVSQFTVLHFYNCRSGILGSGLAAILFIAMKITYQI